MLDSLWEDETQGTAAIHNSEHEENNNKTTKHFPSIFIQRLDDQTRPCKKVENEEGPLTEELHTQFLCEREDIVNGRGGTRTHKPFGGIL